MMQKKQLRKFVGYLYSKLEHVDGAVGLIDELAELIEKEIGDEEKVSTNNFSSDFPLPPEIEKDSEDLAVFSDGACRGNPGPGAWGTMAQNSAGDILFTASGVEVLTTNNQMELEGAYQGLHNLQEVDDFNFSRKVKVYSDSKYVIDGIQKWVPGWMKRGWKKADGKTPENIEYWKKLRELNVKFNDIEYIWVKGHSGHPQNEKCDQLANEALDESGF